MAVAEALEENNYVESLVLAENDIGGRSKKRRLGRVTLASWPFSAGFDFLLNWLPPAEGAAAVLKMATQNAYLHALDLSSNKLGSRGLQSVSAAIRKVGNFFLVGIILSCWISSLESFMA